ncbi:probable cytochrome P450 6a14 [Condylostylus longicornis]|uniref:probable cytochrome P450 6a14 n=1 Tax=Condylostylus longicornis TaxID=2530218 RepID=UPI00244D9F82|nr:probable cytochrome P450 6a14 [Condylostylus longicornis]
MWLSFSIALIVAVILLYWILKFHYKHWERKKIFSPRPSLFYGNTSGKGHFWDIKILYETFKHKKPFFGFFFYIKPMLMITDLDLVKNILIKDFQYFQNRGSFSNPKADPLTGHLINLEDEYWRNLRSKLTPVFSSGKMKYMFSSVRTIGDRLVEVLNDSIRENGNQTLEIEIKSLMSRFTIDVIGTTAFGIDCNTLKDPNSEFNKIGNDIFANGRGKISLFFIRLNLFNLSKILNLRINEKYIIDFFKNLVEQTIKYREENNVTRKDFMDLLIDLKNSPNGLTFNDVLAQCFVFFAAGYETSSSTMTFTLYELAQNLSIQTKVRNEINSILAKYNGEISYEALSEMIYLDQVMNESLRLHTPAPAVFRVANQDYKVPNTNFVIEKGTKILIPYGEFHADPEYFPEPKIFDPERFNADNSKKRHSMAYLPFGDGPRSCIGMRFGKMESKIGIVLLLQNFKFSNSAKTKIPIEKCWNSPAVLQPVELSLKIESTVVKN